MLPQRRPLRPPREITIAPRLAMQTRQLAAVLLRRRQPLHAPRPRPGRRRQPATTIARRLGTPTRRFAAGVRRRPRRSLHVSRRQPERLRRPAITIVRRLAMRIRSPVAGRFRRPAQLLPPAPQLRHNGHPAPGQMLLARRAPRQNAGITLTVILLPIQAAARIMEVSPSGIDLRLMARRGIGKRSPGEAGG